MCLPVKIALVITAVYLVFMIFIAFCDERPARMFHRWRIVEVRKLNGDLEYTVERNGRLGMPFLYSADSGRIGDSYVSTIYSRGLTLEKADRLLEERIGAYRSITERSRTVYWVSPRL